MSPIQARNPEYFKTKIDNILNRIDIIENQTEFTERDVFISADLVQQYIDVLQEMERTHIVYDMSIAVKVSDRVLSFATPDMFANWLEGVME